MTELHHIPTATLRRIVELRTELDDITQEYRNGIPHAGQKIPRRMSPEARQRIIAAQKKRWAAYRKANKGRK
jgi:hypothetical protein